MGGSEVSGHPQLDSELEVRQERHEVALETLYHPHPQKRQQRVKRNDEEEEEKELLFPNYS